MNFKRYFIIFCILVVCTLGFEVQAQVVSYGDEIGQYSFETTVSPAKASKCGKLSQSTEHSKFGEKSLKWQWRRQNSFLEFNTPVPYLAENPNPKETSVSTFVFWIYSPEKIDGQLRISFCKEGRECCHFMYNLGFTGWRASWVAFDRDMTGTPEEGMDKIVISAPAGVKKGTLLFDGVIPSAFEDIRHHSPDFQTPFVNEKTKSHWLVLNNSWNLKLDVPVKEELTESELETMNTVANRFSEIVMEDFKTMTIEQIRDIWSSYNIRYNNDGTINGKPVFFVRFAETFLNLPVKDAKGDFKRAGQLLRDFNDKMVRIAVSYLREKDPKVKAEIASMYIDLTRHILDQGFAAGSGLGTVHHLGYSMRNFYTAPVLMREVLQKAGLASEVQAAMEWFSGVGEVKVAPNGPGIDIDAFNTSLMGRMASILMLEDGPYKYAYMQAIRRWIDNGFKYTGGTNACFKTDGTVHHHRKAYPAYARDGFTGAVNAVWMFHGTDLAISQESHENLKNALLAMRFYSNKESFPIAMSGRHPDGKSVLRTYHYSRLALAGSPDGSQKVDPDMAGAFLRLVDSKGKTAKMFLDAGFKAEEDPNGTHVYGYNCSMTHRQNQWSVTFAGHSRYLWAVETYKGANHYGRYIAHGSMQIISKPDNHPDVFSSGFRQEGWDWCHIPGATAVELPMAQMKSDVRNVDEFSGYEEMLLSDEWFAGGVSHKGNCGAYAMKLHEHDKYNGTLRANKSYFAFGNRIIALGTDLENGLEGAPLHTTLFQNSITPDMPTMVNGEEFSAMSWSADLNGNNVLVDRVGNAYFVKEADVKVIRSHQHSLDQHSDAATEGDFEKAYIEHGTLCGKNIADCQDHYEYLVLVDTDNDEIMNVASNLPYEVLRADKTAHIVKDLPTGITACAAFEETAVDELVLNTTPAMLMYSLDGQMLTLSVSNPDFATYEGPADEILDENGKRIERSVYGRTWVNNSCADTHVTVQIKGQWVVSDASGLKANLDIVYEDGNTILSYTTAEARTEELVLTLLD